MTDVLKLLRYNTGSDKKAFVEFKDFFDAVIFNASIVAYNGAAVSDIVSIHKVPYIIDPQTYILQHDKEAFLSSKDKIKSSVLKYFDELPNQIKNIIVDEKRALNLADIELILDELVDSVYEFQINFLSKFLKNKDYNKYLDFVCEEENQTKGYTPKLILSPYFRLKREYDTAEVNQWLDINKKSLCKFIEKYSGKQYPIATQLLLDKKILCNLTTQQIVDSYGIQGYEYVFVWIDDFSPLTAKQAEQQGFKLLIDAFNSIGKKIVMSYGGYDSILLCHDDLKNRIYGVAQSVGYGESRNITPVGGGLPVNKYYFYPTHQRLTFGDVSNILSLCGYFEGDKSDSAERFYQEICDCLQCKEIIKSNIDNFNDYNESLPYSWKGDIKRNRPTTDASFHAARHFMCCKQKEWEHIQNCTLSDCIDLLKSNVYKYTPKNYDCLMRFLKTYVE